MKKLYFLSTFLCLSLVSGALFAQTTELRKQIKEIAGQIDGTVGVSVLDLDTRDTLSLNGDARMVMHSVFKFPIAMAVLNWVDQGKLKLKQQVHISKADLPKTYSPIRDKYPEGNIELPLSEILSYMVSLSDNNACDILIKLMGGPHVIEQYIHSIGVKNIAIKATEAQMATAWEVQYTNWCHPKAITQLLNILYKGSVLSKTSNTFLWKIMLETTTTPKRLRGLLPSTAQVAHKSGTSPVYNGLAAATNDIGILILPNGQHVALSILITDSTADRNGREVVIARIAKAVWNHYNK